MRELNWRRGKGSCNDTALGPHIPAKTCICVYTCHSQSFYCFLAKGHSLYFILGVPILLQCTLFPVFEVPQEVLFQPLYRFHEAIVQQHTLIRKCGTYMPSAICGTSVGIQIWLSLLSSVFQPSCVQTVKESVEHMTEICSLLKLLIVQHLESTAD